MINDLVDGIVAYFKILPLIRKYRLWPYLLLTGIISLILGGVILFIATTQADNLGSWLVSFYRWDLGKDLFEKFASWMSGIAIVALSLLVFKYLVLIAVAPFMSLLSERIESKLATNPLDMGFSLPRAFKEMIRGIRITIRNLLRELIYTLLILLLGFVPFFTIFITPALFVIQSYYAGFGNMDYYLERHMKIKDSAHFVNQHTGLAISNGALYLLMLLVPVVGLFFAPTLATAAATVEAIKRHEYKAYTGY